MASGDLHGENIASASRSLKLNYKSWWRTRDLYPTQEPKRKENEGVYRGRVRTTRDATLQDRRYNTNRLCAAQTTRSSLNVFTNATLFLLSRHYATSLLYVLFLVNMAASTSSTACLRVLPVALA